MSRTYKDMTFSAISAFAKAHSFPRNEDGDIEIDEIEAWAAARSKHTSQSRGRSNGHGLDMAALARHSRDIGYQKDCNHGRVGHGKLWCEFCADTRQQNYRPRHEVRDKLILLRKQARGIAAEQEEMMNRITKEVEVNCNFFREEVRRRFEIDLCYAQASDDSEAGAAAFAQLRQNLHDINDCMQYSIEEYFEIAASEREWTADPITL